MPKNQTENEVPAVAADAAARKPARVLVAAAICGVDVKCGALVDLPADIADQLQREGVVDTHTDAVAYAISEGQSAITLPADVAPAEQA